MTTLASPKHLAHASSHAVEFEDVGVNFAARNGNVTALDVLSLTVAPGQVFCLLGPNGAGKTTAINVMTGLLRPDSGHIRVAGLDPAQHRREVLERVALVPQETALYERLTGRENLTFHGRYYGVPRSELAGRISGVLDVVGLGDRAADRVETYSGGMRRRLALARALLTQASLVLLDEPTLGVDVQSRNAIWDQVRDLAAAGTAVVLTTNYMDEAETLADWILLVDQGKAIVEGDAAELKARVGQQHLRLRFADQKSATEAADRLHQAPYDAAQRGRTVQLSIPSPSDAVRDFHDLPNVLGSATDKLEHFGVHEPSLQDVFLEYTGRALRD